MGLPHQPVRAYDGSYPSEPLPSIRDIPTGLLAFWCGERTRQLHRTVWEQHTDRRSLRWAFIPHHLVTVGTVTNQFGSVNEERLRVPSPNVAQVFPHREPSVSVVLCWGWLDSVPVWTCVRLRDRLGNGSACGPAPVRGMMRAWLACSSLFVQSTLVWPAACR